MGEEGGGFGRRGVWVKKILEEATVKGVGGNQKIRKAKEKKMRGLIFYTKPLNFLGLCFWSKKKLENQKKGG